MLFLPFFIIILICYVLLQVVKYWAEKGLSGYTVFKYQLRRLLDQPLLTTNQVYWIVYWISFNFTSTIIWVFDWCIQILFRFLNVRFIFHEPKCPGLLRMFMGMLWIYFLELLFFCKWFCHTHNVILYCLCSKVGVWRYQWWVGVSSHSSH